MFRNVENLQISPQNYIDFNIKLTFTRNLTKQI